MSWDTITPPRTAWNRKQGYALRLTNPHIGYLNANAREFLFKGERTGFVVFEQEGINGRMSLVPRLNGLKVNKDGHIAVTSVTARTAAALPLTVVLLPFEDERRLVFAGVKQ